MAEGAYFFCNARTNWASKVDSAGGTALLSYKVRHGHEPGFAGLLVERGFELLHEEAAGHEASLRLVELGAPRDSPS